MKDTSVDQYMIPSTLDAPQMFVFVEMSTAMLTIVPVLVGFLLDIPYVTLPLGLLLSYMYARIKLEWGEGVFLNLAFWYLPSFASPMKSIESYISEYWG